jgi:hypothetical protein
LFAAQFIARGDRDRESRVVPDSASTMPAATDCGSPAVAEAMAQQTNHISLASRAHGGVGRRCGVGRDRGVGRGLPPGVGEAVGVAVGVGDGVTDGVVVGVAVGVAVGLALGVAEGVGVAVGMAVGVGVGVGPETVTTPVMPRTQCEKQK